MLTIIICFFVFLVLRILFYPYTIEEEIIALDEGEFIVSEDVIRFKSNGNLCIRNTVNRMILKGYNFNNQRFIKFRTCGFLYNKSSYKVMLISLPYEEYVAKKRLQSSL